MPPVAVNVWVPPRTMVKLRGDMEMVAVVTVAVAVPVFPTESVAVTVMLPVVVPAVKTPVEESMLPKVVLLTLQE